MIVKKIPLQLALLCCCNFIHSNHCSASNPAQTDTTEPKRIFIGLSGGLEYSRFRDLATSPLFYAGTPLHLSVSYLEISIDRESDFNFAYSVGDFTNRFNNEYSLSRTNSFSLRYAELFALKRLHGSHFNLKVGGGIHTKVIHRNNEGLFNNSEGVDMMFNLSGAAKATWNFNERHRLSFLVNIGLLNSSYRNGFAYTSSSAPLNTDDFFADYEFKVPSGFQSSTALDYTIVLKNHNALEFSYLWSIYRTGAHYENFETASHAITFSLLFNLEK